MAVVETDDKAVAADDAWNGADDDDVCTVVDDDGVKTSENTNCVTVSA